MLVEVYDPTTPTNAPTTPTLLQLINHVGNGFNISRMEISALKTSLTLNSQKNSKTKN